jgi:DNA-directed RNA polymerase specialized sigma24 family protein
LGYTYEEIAQMLQKPSPEAARKTIERAIVRLVQELTRGV